MLAFRAAGVPQRLEVARSSWPGTYEVNEDACADAAAQGLTLLAVADGLGGHAGGEIASRLAVDRAIARFRQQPSADPGLLAGLVLEAHAAVRETRAGRHGAGLRTTLALLVSDGVTARWAHVGDTRVYLFRERMVIARTRDHSVPEMLRRSGEIGDDEIRRHPDRGRLLQALGQESDPKVAVSDAVPLRAGDALLVCTDGWWGSMPDAQMDASLRGVPTPQAWLARMAASIAAAGHVPQDNYTAIAALAV